MPWPAFAGPRPSERPMSEKTAARNDQGGAGEGQRAWTLAEERYRRRGREQRPGTAGQRIDHRQVSGAVGALQQEEVEGMQPSTGPHERERRPSQRTRIGHERHGENR
jgi:hypothetical protein